MSKNKCVLYVVNEAGFFLSHFGAVPGASRDAGYEVHVATPDGPDAKRIEAEGFFFHPIELTRRGINPLRELGGLYRLFRLYRSLRPALIHHVSIKTVLYGGIAARLAGIPAVASTVAGLGNVFVAPGWKASLLRTAVRQGFLELAAHVAATLLGGIDSDETVGLGEIVRTGDGDVRAIVHEF